MRGERRLKQFFQSGWRPWQPEDSRGDRPRPARPQNKFTLKDGAPIHLRVKRQLSRVARAAAKLDPST